MTLLDAPLLLTIWLFAVGACIGSFMNVVVYRLPAGQHLLYPGSRCPCCGKPIRPYHNIPIFGWLALRGRCADCGARISPRYPAVELATALLFALLAWVGPLSGGKNLPGAVDAAHGLLWGIYVYDLTLLGALICAALIDLDGHPLPKRLVATVLVAGLAAPLVWPDLRPVHSGLAGNAASGTSPAWLIGLIDGLAGLSAALILFCLARPAAARGPSGPSGRMNTAAVLAWVGVYLGWQAVCWLAALTAVLFLAGLLVGRHWPAARSVGLPGWLALTTSLWILSLWS